MNSHRDSYLDAVAQGDYTHLTETDHESSDKLTVKSQPAVMPTSVQLSHDASAVLPSRLVTRGASDLDISHRPQTTSANDGAKVRKCFDIFALQREMEEMKQALIFAKIQNTLLKNQLPNLTDSNGRDFSMEFLQCKNDLEMERRKRESLELERNSLASKLEAVETEQNIVDDYEAVIAQLKKERSLLVEKNSELQHDLFIKDAEIRRLNDAFACECPLVEESDSQDTTRSSSISIVSERDKLVDKLESQLAEIKLSQMKTDDQHKKEITAIQKSAADEIRNLKRRMEEREQDFECTRKKLINTYDERIGELQAVISKKDQAISALLNTNVKYPANDNLLTEGNKHLENYLPSASDINTDNSDSSATVASAFGYTQLMKEANERDRMIIARRTRVSGPCGSDGELQQKMKIFEETSSNASDSIRSEPAIAVAYTNCSELSSKNDQISFPVTTDIYNCSMDASFNLIGLRDKLHTLRKICSQLFDRLKGCAGTFQILLEELGKGDAGSKLLEEIEIIQCDLNTSTVQATDVFQQLKAAEQSIHELSYFLEKSMTLAGEGRYVGPDVLVDENMVEKMRTELTGKNAILHKVSAELEEAKVAIHSLKQAEEKARYEIRTYLTTIEGREIELKKAVEIIGERDSVIASLREEVQKWSKISAENQTLITSVRDILGVVPEKLIETISTMKKDLQAECSRNDGLLEQNESLKNSIQKLRDELETLSLSLRNAEDMKVAAETKYYDCEGVIRNMKIQVTKYEERLAVAESRIEELLKDIETQAFKRQDKKDCKMQTDLSMYSIHHLEQEIRNLIVESDAARGNIDHLINENTRTKTKYLELERRYTSLVKSEGHLTPAVTRLSAGVMTVMNGSDILEMKRRLKIHCSFLDHKLRNCGSKINLQLQSNPSKFTTRTLEMIYGILQNYDDETEFEIRNCRDQIKTNNKVLGQWLNTVSPDKEDSNTVRTSYEILMAASGNSGERSSSPFPVAVPSISNSKVSSVSLHALYKLSEEMVQLFKSLTKSEPDIAKAAEMLVHSREIRDNLKKKCQEDSKEDKSKENESSSDPITELKKENTKLHESLAEAQDCLKIAHKKLRNHPDSQTICDKILEELGRIKEVMKLTSANVRLLHKKRDLKAIGAAIVE